PMSAQPGPHYRAVPHRVPRHASHPARSVRHRSRPSGSPARSRTVEVMSASTQGVTESPETTDAATPGALWRRALARAADAATVVLVLWMLVVLQVLWFMDDATRRFDPEPWGRAFVPLLAFIALSAIYEIVFLRFNEGQTPGKDYFHV